MEHKAGLKIEVERILGDSVLTRAPSQSRILRYLLTKGIDSNDPVTQYDIATEALSKPESFDETTDSSVRVQIGRLRHSLEEYYRLNQPVNSLCAYIPSNEYRIRMAKLHLAYPNIQKQLDRDREQNQMVISEIEVLAPPAQAAPPLQIVDSPKQTLGKRYFWIAALGILAALLFGLDWEETALPSIAAPAMEPPKVTYTLIVAVENDATNDLAEFEKLVAIQVRTILTKSMVSRALDESDPETPDYRVQIAVTKQPNQNLLTSVTLLDRDDSLIAARELSSETLDDAQQGIQDILIGIVSPAGLISNDLAQKIDVDPKNGFECFIAAETYRSNGASGSDSLLETCLTKYPDDAYFPYLAVRRIFQRIQSKKLRGVPVGPDSPEWKEASQIISDDPTNAYANTIAAKLLIGNNSCLEAEPFASEAFSRGRTFPALELAVIVDAYSCDGVVIYQDYWSERIKRITEANPKPHPLLESYILLGLLVSDQTALIDTLKPLAFATDESSQLENFNLALRTVLQGKGNSAERQLVSQTLRALIWNEKTRYRIESKLPPEEPSS